jgi:GxxExxY protein
MYNSNLTFDDLSHEVIGAAIEVHKILGPGFIESIYHNAMKIELALRCLKFETEEEFKINYKYKNVGIHRADLVIEDKIIVELKAVQNINDVHIAQVLSYLKASGIRIALILNFSKLRLEIQRKVLDYEDL